MKLEGEQKTRKQYSAKVLADYEWRKGPSEKSNMLRPSFLVLRKNWLIGCSLVLADLFDFAPDKFAAHARLARECKEEPIERAMEKDGCTVKVMIEL